MSIIAHNYGLDSEGKPIDPGEGYRLVEFNEQLQREDESTGCGRDWGVIGDFTTTVSESLKTCTDVWAYRRRIQPGTVKECPRCKELEEEKANWNVSGFGVLSFQQNHRIKELEKRVEELNAEIKRLNNPWRSIDDWNGLDITSERILVSTYTGAGLHWSGRWSGAEIFEGKAKRAGWQYWFNIPIPPKPETEKQCFEAMKTEYPEGRTPEQAIEFALAWAKENAK